MFKDGDIVKITGHFPSFAHLEWTVLDAEASLLACPDFPGHSGTLMRWISTAWEGHCLYIPKETWILVDKLEIEENE